MTPNEKAATFIGWGPGQQCNGSFEYGRCRSCGYKRGPAETPKHDIVAPEMADPRNWVKALETILVQGVYTPQIVTSGAGWDIRFDQLIDLPDMTMRSVGASGRNLAKAAIAALAALYDAKNAESNIA